MKRYLVESFAPAGTAIAEVEQRARRVARDLSEAGMAVRYVEPIFVPADETCFHLLEAESSAAAEKTIRLAGVQVQRITEAVK